MTQLDGLTHGFFEGAVEAVNEEQYVARARIFQCLDEVLGLVK
eukprot:CAMPEP_0195648266 /NCGR_PEP_ID=MMETSP0815-20121206/30545_1 /TAXON_ID=97485 /ORGANISM="Prymnesium parvum, Strain Texoma1" /LENGTH=42 /DNA_ID= /DNA_START= /DNA_END= /DNA_ORIENTATION=